MTMSEKLRAARQAGERHGRAGGCPGSMNAEMSALWSATPGLDAMELLAAYGTAAKLAQTYRG